MSMNELREGFFQECEDLLEALSDGMAVIDAGNADSDTLNAIFRAVHSIKGGAAAFGLEALVEFSHAFENVLDAARADRLTLQGEALALCFRAADRLADLVADARADQPSDSAASATLIAGLDRLLGAPSDAPPAAPAPPADEAVAPAFTPLSAPVSFDLPAKKGGAPAAAPDAAGGMSHYCIRFAPSRETYATGNEPALLFRALAAMGDLSVKADLSRVPPLLEMAWDEGYIIWNLTLHTRAGEDRLREVFDFVEGACNLDIRRLDAATLAGPQPGPAGAPGGTAADAAAAPAPATPSPAPDTVATDEPAARPGQGAPARATIRVDLERVDRLINLVGELVINQAMLSQSIDEANLPSGNGVDSAMGQLRQLSSELQERVMAIRAQPVKPLFQRMSRIVREAGHASAKLARLVTSGEATEVDKTVIERLADPLTHMIRNAIDHGLESPEARKQAGKPPEGIIRLSAGHRSGRVVIELSDDGAGINRARVHETAVARGLIAPEKDLSDEEIDNLLFMPGFSTSPEVSALSGRGVGMDVVKSEIQRLGGRVTLASMPGRGTTVTISLPLTLAVLEGMVVEVAGETLVVPTTALRETLKAAAADVQRIGAHGWFIAIRGGFVPIVDLGAELGFQPGPEGFVGRVLLLIESGSGRRAALAVDRVLDQREVVIKGLENNYGHVPGIAAATILGNGRIALIIDPDEISAAPAPGPGAAAPRPALATAAGA
ncbi:chemotaxis protein CheA [Alkalilacustris brevis]|uniref:chemotaxis protein CheA n=1 Tax=Alkalilacustris brevis TaxID=2026338 RepID=UPI000E0CFAF3|nr:chemotaxis protein CheA [Alkalilacustris brevis]